MLLRAAAVVRAGKFLLLKFDNYQISGAELFTSLRALAGCRRRRLKL